MAFIANWFHKPYPSYAREEVERALDELVRIGRTDDFLSERPGGGFNRDCRHIRTREIGERLNELGGEPLMEYAFNHVRHKLGKDLSWHLQAAWKDIGEWIH